MAKNTKGGLGRGLNSLIGGYEAPLDAEQLKTAQPTPAEVAEKTAAKVEPVQEPEKTTTPEREVIREEDLPQEDRAVLDTDKRINAMGDYYAAPSTNFSENVGKSNLKDVVAKKELIEENDGVTIKGVVERDPNNVVAEQKVPEPKVEEPQGEVIREVLIDMVRPNPNQPRTHFNKIELEELSASIERDGLLQPILVREVADGYEIVAGERRWQACRMAGMATIPVRTIVADDDKVLELALIENVQRTDLNPIEEAYGYKRIMERGPKTQSEVAAIVSKGRSTIANALRLLDLPEEAQQLLFEEKITAGHARAILSVPTTEGRKKLTEKLANEKLSVRETEQIARLMAGREEGTKGSKKAPAPKLYKTAARSLSDSLNAKVKVHTVGGKNKIEIEFADEDDLQRLFDLISSAAETE